MADFKKYIPKLKRWEGGWSEHKSDLGGSTNCGVTLNTFRQFFGKDKTVEDLKSMTSYQWETIMRTYWNRCRGDQIENQSIAELFVDWHINAGVNAIKQTQKMFCITADGLVGPVTLRYLNSPNREVIFNRLKERREQYYYNIVRSNPSQRVFLNGWLNRTRSFKYEDRPCGQ